MDAAPFIENGRTYIPVRFLANSLAVPNDDIRWDTEKQEITIYSEDVVIRLYIDNEWKII